MDSLGVTQCLADCLYEAQIEVDSDLLFGRYNIKVRGDLRSPLHGYALGYCIAKSSSTTSWEVYLSEGSAEAFMWGLKSCQHGHGSISHLTLHNVHSTFLDSFPTAVLQGIEHLSLCNDAPIDKSLATAIPLLKHLSSLSLHLESHSVWTIPLLNKLANTNVTALLLILSFGVCSYVCNSEFLTSVSNLINPSTGRLKHLYLFSNTGDYFSDTNHLCQVLFQSSSLNSLIITANLLCSPNWLDLLKTNTCLSIIRIIPYRVYNKITLVMLTELLRVNKTVKALSWAIISDEKLNEQCIRDFNAALRSNTTLKELYLRVFLDKIKFFPDPRLRVEQDCDITAKKEF